MSWPFYHAKHEEYAKKEGKEGRDFFTQFDFKGWDKKKQVNG